MQSLACPLLENRAQPSRVYIQHAIVRGFFVQFIIIFNISRSRKSFQWVSTNTNKEFYIRLFVIENTDGMKNILDKVG